MFVLSVMEKHRRHAIKTIYVLRVGSSFLRNAWSMQPAPQHKGIFDMKFHTPNRQRGQGMTEYLIIVALIAVAAIGVYSYFGKTVREQTAGLAKEVAGQDAGTQITNAGTAATTANTKANANKGLSAYAGNQ
jgi:Flp pilus assembly pilin Flp